jgi:transposase
MKIINLFHNVNTSCFKINTNIEEELIKDEDIILKRQKYLCFNKLLEQNKSIKKGSNKRISIKEIERITGMSKSTYYRIKEKIEIKGFTFWKSCVKQKTKPKRVRISKIPQEYKNIILDIRSNNPTYSEKKIETILLRDNNIKLSHRTIGKILKQFNKLGLINIKGSKLNKIKLKPNEIYNTKPRDFNKSYSKRRKYKED